MLNLPVELKLPILHHVKDSLSSTTFDSDSELCIASANAYNKFLFAFSLFHRESTTMAQYELWRNMIVGNRNKMSLLLELLRANEGLRVHARTSRSMRIGSLDEYYIDTSLKEKIDQIADYCPNLLEISCYRFGVKLDSFQSMTNLRKLELSNGSIMAHAMIQSSNLVTLSIISLSLDSVTFSDLLDPLSFPFLRSIRLSNQTHLDTIVPLLAQITSLTLDNSFEDFEVDILLAESTSLTFLSIPELNLPLLATIAMKDKLETLKFIIEDTHHIEDSLGDLIRGGRSMKKVILDASKLQTEAEEDNSDIYDLMDEVEKACKEKNIELWCENFSSHGNGKVNLDRVRGTTSLTPPNT